MTEDDGAFMKMAKLALDDAFASVSASLEGRPYKSKIVWPRLKYYIVEALCDHTRYIDAGIGGVQQEIKKGQILETQDISINSLDMSKFKLLREEER